MKYVIVPLSVLLLWISYPAHGQNDSKVSDFLKNESAPGSRASMGIFASAYGNAVASRLFDYDRYSWKNRLTSAAVAALGYQLISYDTQDGVEFKPFKLNKQWKGYWEGYLAGEGLDIFLWIVRKYSGAKFIVSSSLMISMSIVIAVGEEDKAWRKADDGPLTLRNLFRNRHSWWTHFAGSGGL